MRTTHAILTIFLLITLLGFSPAHPAQATPGTPNADPLVFLPLVFCSGCGYPNSTLVANHLTTGAPGWLGW